MDKQIGCAVAVGILAALFVAAGSAAEAIVGARTG